MQVNKVLVFPRVVFAGGFSLALWDSIQAQIEEIECSFEWFSRPDAESSIEWVQAIPCAFIRDEKSNYCVLRRVENSRFDLNKKLSLIVGGHIDEEGDSISFRSALPLHLRRELEEEVGVRPNVNPSPIGVIIDNSSVVASRHVAFVHETIAEAVSLKAPEEFTMRSKFTGEFWGLSQVVEKRNAFDPWSRTLIEEYLCPGLHRQLSMSLD